MYGSIIKILRKEKNMTQVELAKLLDFKSSSAIGMIEREERELNLNTLLKISEIFNVSTDYILGKENLKKDEETTSLEEINTLIENSNLGTIAAHLDGNEFSKEDLEDIEDFIKYVSSRKK